VTLDHIDPMCSLSFSSIHISLHALILYLSLILWIWVYTWLVMLSHAVMSVVQVLPSFVMLSLAYVFVSDGRHPLRCDLTLVRIDVVV
jgi:ABC-type proline/glycine betaine transport system permease subunit